jgi:hypothetical protein
VCTESAGEVMSSKAILFTILLAMLISLPAGAQQNQRKTETARFGTSDDASRIFQDYLYGVVKSISKGEMVLDKTAMGNGQVFQLSPKTKFIQDQKPSSADKLKVGDQVWVDMKKDKAGNMLARKVISGIALAKEP